MSCQQRKISHQIYRNEVKVDVLESREDYFLWKCQETDLILLQNSKYIQKKWSRKEYNVAELNGVNAQNN